MKNKVIIYRRELARQFAKGSITQKRFQKELKWIKNKNKSKWKQK